MFKQSRQNETGRSMVEMLGVLAIIGVLSVGGIYGYTIAMRKYRANEIVQRAGMLVVMATSADGGRGDCLTLSQSGLGTRVGGLEVEMSAEELSGDDDTTNMTVQVQIKSGLDSDGIDALQDAVESITDNAGYTIEFSDEELSCDE